MRRGIAIAGLLAAAAAGAARASETVTYGYDGLGRLTGTATTGSVNDNAASAIGYDPAGNRKSYEVSGAPGPAPPPGGPAPLGAAPAAVEPAAATPEPAGAGTCAPVEAEPGTEDAAPDEAAPPEPCG
jgi:hypothetical protein